MLDFPFDFSWRDAVLVGYLVVGEVFKPAGKEYVACAFGNRGKQFQENVRYVGPEYEPCFVFSEHSYFCHDGHVRVIVYLNVEFSTNISELTVEYPDGKPEWIEFVERKDAFGSTFMIFNVNENEIYKDKTVAVRISGGETKADITVNQEQLDHVESEMDGQAVEYGDMSAKTLEVKVYSNIENCRVDTPTWIEVSEPIKGDMREEGLTEYTYSFKIAEAKASRNGEIRFGEEEGYNSTIDVSDCMKLADLSLSGVGSLSELKLGKSLVEEVEIGASYSGTSAESLVVSGENLKSFTANSNGSSYAKDNLKTLDITGCPALTSLEAVREVMDYDTWTKVASLETIYVTAAQKSAIDAGTLTVTKSEGTEIVVK